MTAVLLSVAIEETSDGPMLVTTWEPTDSERRAFLDNAPTIIGDLSRRLARVEREPYTNEALSTLFATYGERPITVALDVADAVIRGK